MSLLDAVRNYFDQPQGDVELQTYPMVRQVPTALDAEVQELASQLRYSIGHFSTPSTRDEQTTYFQKADALREKLDLVPSVAAFDKAYYLRQARRIVAREMFIQSYPPAQYPNIFPPLERLATSYIAAYEDFNELMEHNAFDFTTLRVKTYVLAEAHRAFSEKFFHEVDEHDRRQAQPIHHRQNDARLGG